MIEVLNLEFESDNEVCQHHNKIWELYWTDCQQAVCNSWLVSDSHFGHRFEDMNGLWEKAVSKLIEANENITKRISKFDKDRLAIILHNVEKPKFSQKILPNWADKIKELLENELMKHSKSPKTIEEEYDHQFEKDVKNFSEQIKFLLNVKFQKWMKSKFYKQVNECLTDYEVINERLDNHNKLPEDLIVVTPVNPQIVYCELVTVPIKDLNSNPFYHKFEIDQTLFVLVFKKFDESYIDIEIKKTFNYHKWDKILQAKCVYHGDGLEELNKDQGLVYILPKERSKFLNRLMLQPNKLKSINLPFVNDDKLENSIFKNLSLSYEFYIELSDIKQSRKEYHNKHLANLKEKIGSIIDSFMQ